jgi:transcription elongation factor Elf1
MKSNLIDETVPDLSAPIDVYSEWVDAAGKTDAHAAQKKENFETHEY